MIDSMPDMVSTIRRRMDDALIEGLQALDKGDIEAYNKAYSTVVHCNNVLTSLRIYLTEEIINNKEQACLH